MQENLQIRLCKYLIEEKKGKTLFRDFQKEVDRILSEGTWISSTMKARGDVCFQMRFRFSIK